MDVTFAATGIVRTNLSIPHLLSAAFFSRKTAELEEMHKDAEFGSFWEEILANAVATVLVSVAAMEAYINEIFADRAKNFQHFSEGAMSAVWDAYETKPILDKFNFALLLKCDSSYDKGNLIYQDAVALIRLRNSITHFHPEWEHEQVDHKKLSQQLSGKIQKSIYFPNEGLFPRAWAGHSATVWAVQTVTAFLVDFETKGGFSKKVAKFTERLQDL